MKVADRKLEVRKAEGIGIPVGMVSENLNDVFVVD
jgi:hypothetical protein